MWGLNFHFRLERQLNRVNICFACETSRFNLQHCMIPQPLQGVTTRTKPDVISEKVYVTLISLSLADSKRFTFFCILRLLPSLRENLPYLTCSPINKNSSILPSPQSNNIHFPDNVQNYCNQSITFSQQNQGSPHPLVTTNPATHSPCLFRLLPSSTQCYIVSY